MSDTLVFVEPYIVNTVHGVGLDHLGLKPMVRGSTILRNHEVASIEPYIAKHLLVISTSVNLLQITNKGCLKARANTFSL